MKRSEAIANLLRKRAREDLAQLYNDGMEVQVNVAQDGGERIDGDYKGKNWHGWSDGITTWKPFRIPHNAKTEPEANDYEIKFDLAAHADAIGMTGWNWQLKQSLWVAFDFDAIVGHSDKHAKKLSDSELQDIQNRVESIPWVTIRKSKSGSGLHLYVFLKPFPTNNHVEHAAVARAILGQMAGLTGFDLQSKVDACGGNMWVWHRSMNPVTGFELIKSGTILDSIPINWQDHLTVLTNRSKRTVPSHIKDSGLANDVERLWEEMTSAKSKIPLDSDHQKLIKFLHDAHAQSWWDSDNHMLVTHTVHLKEAHEKLGMRGIFRTNAKGTEYGHDHNCYLFPLRRGGWTVRRYTPGVAEESTWDQDNNGWTRCFFNVDPDLHSAARAYGGIEHEKGGYTFREIEVAIKSANMIGIHPKLPNYMMNRPARLRERSDGRLIFQFDEQSHDKPEDMVDWIREKGKWTRVYTLNKVNTPEPEIGNYEDMIRHLITETNDDCGWLIKTDGSWQREPLVHVKTLLASFNMKPPEINRITGSCIAKPWRLVCRPFQPEVLGNRVWNRNAPQLSVNPTVSDSLSYPTWLAILNHCGKGLDDAIKVHAWSKANAIMTGADYLKVWIASLFKEPLEPLPYLFFYGDQNCGKSILHEGLSLLMTTGVARADNALINQNGFNGELEGAVLCVVEETDMSKSKLAYNRIKDWVTGKNLPIHKKGQTPYHLPNSTHWIQCANDYKACPILPGDSRITMSHVPTIDPADLIPKKQLLTQLQKEAPDFLAAILALELPASGDRLNVPVVATSEKRHAERANQTYLEYFFDEKCFFVPGSIVLFSEFYDRFQEWADVDQLRTWTKIKIGKELPAHFPKGRSRKDNQVIIGNISFTKPNDDDRPLPKLILVGDHLEPSR